MYKRQAKSSIIEQLSRKKKEMAEREVSRTKMCIRDSTTESDRSVMLFTLTGKIMIGETAVEEKTAAKLLSGTSVSIKSLQEPAQVLFMSSEALNEPVAWGGPVVMNTREELQEAWKELENDTFVRRT